MISLVFLIEVLKLNFRYNFVENLTALLLKFLIFMKHISKLITFLIYEFESVSQRLFCTAYFTASFYDREKFLSSYFSINKFKIQIESGLVGYSLYHRYNNHNTNSPLICFLNNIHRFYLIYTFLFV